MTVKITTIRIGLQTDPTQRMLQNDKIFNKQKNH